MFKAKPIHRIIFIIVLLGFMSCSSDNGETNNDPVIESNQNPVEDPMEEVSLEQRIQAIINSKVGEDKLVGVAMSIRVDGVERWAFTGGVSEQNVPVAKNMRFGIASITKTVVAATILKLEEEGLLSLQDPISKWLTLNSDNVDESITIFQLLNHLTGLKGYFQHSDIWPRVEDNLDNPINPLELVDYIGEPLFLPGEQYQYSNSNYLILGLIIEAVAQKTVGEVMREKFWGPLELNSMYFGANEPIGGTLAIPWRDSNGDGTLENISQEFRAAYHSIFYTAADVFATASDLSMWAQHLFNGSAVTPTSLEKMLTFINIDDPIFNGYGLGIRRVRLANRTTWGHTGGMRGYGSYMFYDPISKVSIAMLNNQSRSENGPLLRYDLVQQTLFEVFAELNREAEGN